MCSGLSKTKKASYMQSGQGEVINSQKFERHDGEESSQSNTCEQPNSMTKDAEKSKGNLCKGFCKCR